MGTDHQPSFSLVRKSLASQQIFRFSKYLSANVNLLNSAKVTRQRYWLSHVINCATYIYIYQMTIAENKNINVRKKTIFLMITMWVMITICLHRMVTECQMMTICTSDDTINVKNQYQMIALTLSLESDSNNINYFILQGWMITSMLLYHPKSRSNNTDKCWMITLILPSAELLSFVVEW